MSAKILSLDQLAERSGEIRGRGGKIVATNGCFDLLHVGHVRYLSRARQLGDELIVGVNGDSSVRALKGEGRPLNSASDRAEVLAALESVSFVTIFPEKRATTFLQRARPTMYVKGGDYTPETLDEEERAALADMGAEIQIVRLETGYSTSSLIDRLR